MKKILLLLICFCFLTLNGQAYNVWAPNSFDPVERKQDAYKIIVELVAQGYSPQYESTVFERKHISRYEFAKIVKDLLENQNDMKLEEQSSLQKVKKEYSRELDSLGYKEQPTKRKELGNMNISGDVKLGVDNTEGGKKGFGRARVGIFIGTENKDEQAKEEKRVK